MSWLGERSKFYSILIGKFYNQPLRRLWRRQGTYFQMDLEEVGCEYANLSNCLKDKLVYGVVFGITRKLH